MRSSRRLVQLLLLANDEYNRSEGIGGIRGIGGSDRIQYNQTDTDVPCPTELHRKSVSGFGGKMKSFGVMNFVCGDE
jgi:hypothetical protein